jgi:hypothetical protein
VWHYSVHLRKGEVVLSQCPLVQWALGHWHYERTLHSRRPLRRDRSFYLSQALSLVEKAELVQVCFTLRLRDRWSMWMHDGCKVYMNSYMASDGSCFMVPWTIFKNHLLEVGLTQNRETMALRMLKTVHLFSLGPVWIETCWNNNWLRARSHMTSHYTWGSVTTLDDFGGVLGQPLDMFFWALTTSWSWLLARVWSGPKFEVRR